MTLANDYRPKRLEDLHGQERAVLILKQFVKRLKGGGLVETPALLLYGPRGSGKTSAARIVGDLLNGKPGAWAVNEVDGARNGGVDNIRSLDTLARTSHRGDYRIIIIDEAQCLSQPAFSAFLKQLEEPPPNVLYILVTTDISRIPETVCSRCFPISFSVLDEVEIAAGLAQIAISEKLTGEPAALEYIASRCEGDMRRAVMMLDQLVTLGEVTLSQAANLWPEPAGEFGEKFIKSAQEGDVRAAMDCIHSAFRSTRNSTVLWNRITNEMRQRALSAQTSDGKAKVARLISELWRFRIGVRAMAEDVAPIEGFWFTCADILAGGFRQMSRPDVQRQAPSADLVSGSSNGNPFAHLEKA